VLAVMGKTVAVTTKSIRDKTLKAQENAVSRIEGAHKTEQQRNNKHN
jgi:hypothetical protein